jgi:hypothetical protein
MHSGFRENAEFRIQNAEFARAHEGSEFRIQSSEFVAIKNADSMISAF